MDEQLDLSRPCDACGKKIGGGFSRCGKCSIWLCMFCRIQLAAVQKVFPEKCPMCGQELTD